MIARRWRIAGVVAVIIAGCSSSKTPGQQSGEGAIRGAVQGLQLQTAAAVAIANATPPATQIVIAPDSVTCGLKGGGDRIILDVARSKVGSFTVVTGHPFVANLGDTQARAAACPSGDLANQAPCHELVRVGTVEITRFDPAPGGRVEGTFRVDFADGSVNGTFSALRCS